MTCALQTLVLVRHASAETPGGNGDEARALTERGVAEARALAGWLQEQGLLGDAVVCSPALRTRETWAAIQEESGHGVLIDIEPAVYEASVETLLRVLRDAAAVHPEAMTLVVVGHAPGIPSLAAILAEGGERTGPDAGLADGFPPASAAVVRLTEGVESLTPSGGELVAVRLGDTATV